VATGTGCQLYIKIFIDHSLKIIISIMYLS